MKVRATGFFALRTPLLPVEDLLGWSTGLHAAAMLDASRLEATMARDRAELRRRLRVIIERPEVREALFIASPSLDDSLPLWLEQPDSARGKRVEHTLVRYFSRMAGRSTPFGLFAGCSVGTIGEATHLLVEARDRYRRHSRLDTDYLWALCEHMSRNPALRRVLTWRPNSSLYRVAGQVRYIEAQVRGLNRSYQLVATELTPYLEATLARAADGARPDELAQALAADGVTLDEASDYIEKLADAQLLVSELEPRITGPEPIREIVAQLRAAAVDHAPAARVASLLERTRTDLEALDAEPLGAPRLRYQTIAKAMRTLAADRGLSRIFQVDMFKPAPAATLGPAPLAEVVRAVALLHGLSSPNGQNDPFSKFREAFNRRYHSRSVPLAQVLDEEIGIGFDRSSAPGSDTSPLLEGLQFGRAEGDTAQPNGVRFDLLLRKLMEALRTGAPEIVLQEQTLAEILASNGEKLQLPDSLAAMVTLAAASDEDLAAGEFQIYVSGVSGPSGATLLGRFCHGDQTLSAHVRAYLRLEEEQHPDAIFAEVVHLPEGRFGNVVLRPCLRDSELPLLGRSGVAMEHQILLDDLWVSLRGDRIVLQSLRFGREVIPRLTAAHNFTDPRNLGVYRFLCSLQNQNSPLLRFSWGALDRAPFLPRVRVGRIVLSLARWRLGAQELGGLTHARGAHRFVEAQALRRALDLPRWVGIADGDNVLPIDFDNVLSVESFAQLVKSKKQVILRELFGFNASCIRGPEGRFVHELIVPLISRPATTRQEPSRTVQNRTSPQPVRRLFIPGSEWLFAKIYTGRATADAILCDVIAPIVAQARRSGAVDSWFFARYADPDWQLRIRFHGAPRRLISEILPALSSAVDNAISRNQVWKFQLDTYEREVERYGGPSGVLLSEQLFCADSEAVLNIVQNLRNHEDNNMVWRLALRGIDQLLQDLGLKLREKHALVSRRRDSIARSFGDRLAAKQVGDRFRQERRALEEILNRSQDGNGHLVSALALLAWRSDQTRQIVADLHAAENEGELTASVMELAESYIHMHTNRIFRSAARAQEFVLYDFLARLYEGQMVHDS